MKTTSENIQKLSAKQIFVFGSNLAGAHGGGAALLAANLFGAIDGQGIGLQGKSYALPTKDVKIKTLSLEIIQSHVNDLLAFIQANPKKEFLITQVGCGLAGYSPSDIAPLFKDFMELPNITLPESFIEILNPEIVIHGFKGFNQDLTCRDFPFELNKEYIHEGQVKACNSGFHFCENPLDIFNYYPPGKSRFAEVTGKGQISQEQSDSKVACSHLSIGAEVSLKSIIEGGIKFIFSKVKWSDENTTYGINSGATSNGNRSGATSNGNRSGATSNGDGSGATSNGNRSGATSNGNRSGATSNGNRSGATSNGNRSGATSNGYGSGAMAIGDYSKASAVKNSIATAIGVDGKVKGSIGSWLVLTECAIATQWQDDTFYIKDVKSVKVDGVEIKEDTYYKLVDGQIIEA